MRVEWAAEYLKNDIEQEEATMMWPAVFTRWYLTERIRYRGRWRGPALPIGSSWPSAW